MSDETTPGPDLRERITAALTAEHYRRARERIVASPEEHSAAMADAVLAVVAAAAWEERAPATLSLQEVRALVIGTTRRRLGKHEPFPDAAEFLANGVMEVVQDAVAQRDAEIDALRAGESEEPAAECERHTPAQWLHRFNRITGEQRITHIEAMFSLTEQATECWLQDHAGYKHQLDAANNRIVALLNGEAFAELSAELYVANEKLERIRTYAELWRLQRPAETVAMPTPKQFAGELAAGCGDAILTILDDAAGGAG